MLCLLQACAGLVLLTLFVQSSVAKESKEVARLKRDRLGEFLDTQQQLLNASFIAKWNFSFNSWILIWFFYSGVAIEVFKIISNLVDVSSLGELFWKRFPVERFPSLSSPQPNSLLTVLLSLLLTLTHNKSPSSYWSFTYSHTIPL